MPNKPIADWTLGEVKAECDSRRKSGCKGCKLENFCDCSGGEDPCNWVLIDPPRFDADELAFMRMLYKGGARWLARDDNGSLFWYHAQPQKGSHAWSASTYTFGKMPSDMLRKIQWTDAEPVEIAKYIEKGGEE
jgi:hypothetical protein